jgi:hypothetical protein
MKKKVLTHSVPLSYAEGGIVKHELIEWNERVVHSRTPEYYRNRLKDSKTVSREPTYDDWHAAALRFVHSDSIEDYNEMLSLVRLTHPHPNLWNESETIVTSNESERTKALTLVDVWYATRKWSLPILALLFFVLAIAIAHT